MGGELWKGAPGYNREREGGRQHRQTQHSRGRNRRQMGERLRGKEIMEAQWQMGREEKIKDTTRERKGFPRVPTAGPGCFSLLPRHPPSP